MKVSEKLIEHDDKLVLQTAHDMTPAFEHVRQLRDRGADFGESKIIASVPAAVVFDWLKEAGVRPDDPAADDVIKRKLLSGDVSKFRVWNGTY